MYNLFVNILRGVKKRLMQYFGIVVLLIVVISSLSALYSNADRLQAGFFTVLKNSGKYDYRINVELLNNYKNISSSTNQIKEIIKKQFKNYPDEEVKKIIFKQIDNIEENNISNNTFPDLDNSVSDLKTYLLNWGVNYQTILLNEILNEESKSQQILQSYKFTKSFLKTFDYQSIMNNKNVYYSLEDAFYDSDANKSFDYAPRRNNINEVYIEMGRKPTNSKEVVINPVFANKNGIKLNDEVVFIRTTDQGELKLKVVGLGYAYWGITGNSTPINPNPTPTTTTPLYMWREDFNSLILSTTNRSKLQDIFFLKLNKGDNHFTEKLQQILIETFSFNFGTVITADTEDFRSGRILETFAMENIVFSAITFVVLLVIVFIIMAYVRKEVDLQKPQLGLLKALGYKNGQIILGFVVLIFSITIIANILGLVMGLGLQIIFNSLNNIGFFMPLPTLFFSWIVFFIGLLLVPLIFIFATYLQSNAKLHIGALALIYDRTRSSSSKMIAVLKYPFRYWPFKQRLAIAFTLKSVGKLFLVFFTFIFVTFLLVFQSTATDLFDNKINNLYDYYNKDVKWSAATSSMYTYNSSNRITNDDTITIPIDKQIFDWASEKDIANDINNKYHQWIATDFQLDSEEKINKITDALALDNFKDYFINSTEMTKLYQNTKTLEDCKKFINPNNIAYLNAIIEQFYGNIRQFFDYIIVNANINPEKQPLPGISLGLNIYNNENYYPSIKTDIRTPEQWDEHNQGRMLAKKIKVLGLYNDIDQKISWKNWFNFKEQKHRDIDPIFNTSHELKKEAVKYTNNQGEEKKAVAYVVPAAISKSLAILNGYKINNQFLMLTSWYNFSIPIIFEVKGIIENNLDTSDVYTNLDDLRTAIGLLKIDKSLRKDSFNYLISKEDTLLPLNYANILQPDGEYNRTEILAKNLSSINKTPFINRLIKELFTKILDGVRTIINITKILTLIGVAFILIIIVNMILDNNLLIIAMMKSLGYRVNEINRLIIGSYVIALLIAFILGTIISYVVWNFITIILATQSGNVFNVPINAVTILSSFGMVSLVMIIGYAVGLYLIKYKPITSLLQGN